MAAEIAKQQEERLKYLGSLRPSTEAKTPKPRKVSKKSPERSLGPPDPGPPKGSKKRSEKSKEIVDFDYFSDFSDFFSELFGGPGSGGSQTPLGRLFGDFSGFRGFGLCRWRARSQSNIEWLESGESLKRYPEIDDRPEALEPSKDSIESLQGFLVAPYRAILRYYRCDTPYRAMLFKGV